MAGIYRPAKRLAYVRAVALLALLLLPILAQTVHAAETIPLDWVDSGEDIEPGHIYPITIHAEYQRLPFSGVATEPAMQAGPLKIEVDAEMSFLGGVEFRTRVYVNGQLVWESEPEGCGVLCARYEYGLPMTLDCDCDGNCVLRLQESGQEVAHFTISHPVDIFYDDAVLQAGPLDFIEGRIRVLPPSRNYVCDPGSEDYNTVDYSDVNLPGVDNWMEMLQVMLSRINGSMQWAVTAGLIVLVVGMAVVVLLIVYRAMMRQAKRRKLV